MTLGIGLLLKPPCESHSEKPLYSLRRSHMYRKHYIFDAIITKASRKTGISENWREIQWH